MNLTTEDVVNVLEDLIGIIDGLPTDIEGKSNLLITSFDYVYVLRTQKEEDETTGRIYEIKLSKWRR